MVEEVALESLQPTGRFVRREWRDGGSFPGYASGFYPLILHRNLAFFRKVCKAVLEKLNMEMYSRGRKREHSKCFRSRERRVGSTPTISAKWGGKDGNVLASCFLRRQKWHLLPKSKP